MEVSGDLVVARACWSRKGELEKGVSTNENGEACWEEIRLEGLGLGQSRVGFSKALRGLGSSAFGPSSGL